MGPRIIQLAAKNCATHSGLRVLPPSSRARRRVGECCMCTASKRRSALNKKAGRVQEGPDEPSRWGKTVATDAKKLTQAFDNIHNQKVQYSGQESLPFRAVSPQHRHGWVKPGRGGCTSHNVMSGGDTRERRYKVCTRCAQGECAQGVCVQSVRKVCTRLAQGVRKVCAVCAQAVCASRVCKVVHRLSASTSASTDAGGTASSSPPVATANGIVNCPGQSTAERPARSGRGRRARDIRSATALSSSGGCGTEHGLISVCVWQWRRIAHRRRRWLSIRRRRRRRWPPAAPSGKTGSGAAERRWWHNILIGKNVSGGAAERHCLQVNAHQKRSAFGTKGSGDAAERQRCTE